MKRIKLIHGSARVKDDIEPKMVKALNVAVILAHQQLSESKVKVPSYCEGGKCHGPTFALNK